MKKLLTAASFVFVIGATLSCLAAELPAQPASPPEDNAQLAADIDSFLTPDNMAKLEQDKVVMVSKSKKDEKGKSRAHGRAIVIIKRPFDPIWNQLTHNEDWPEFFPNLASSQTYIQEGNTAGLYEVVKALFMTFRYHAVHVRDKENGIIRWHLDRTKKNDIVDTSGSWLIRRHGENACIVVYSVFVDSGMSLPKPVEDFFQVQSLRNVVKALKKRLEAKP